MSKKNGDTPMQTAENPSLNAPPVYRPERRYDVNNLVDVMEQIEEAVRTLRKLPRVAVKNRFSMWPDVLQSFFEAYGYTDTHVRMLPTSKQITRMDRVIEWLTWVPSTTAKIIWARAENFSWRSIGRMVGKDPKTCKECFRVGVVVISVTASKK